MSKNSTKNSQQTYIITKKFPKIQADNANPFQNLLVVGGVHINRKKIQGYDPQIKSKECSARKKSHRSFGNRLEHTIQLANLQIKQRKDCNNSQKAKLTKQTAKCNIYQYKEQAQMSKPNSIKEKIINDEKQEFVFVQKKMKLGHKGKANLMKQFIIDTLMKGKVQGNCLTIFKGTAQCTNSPKKQFNQPQVSRKSQQKYPLILVQQRSHRILPNRGKRFPPLPLNKPKVPNSSQHHTAVNLPSLSKNKKWVAMMKQMQKRQIKDQEIIEQIIVQQNKTDSNEIQEIIFEQIKQ